MRPRKIRDEEDARTALDAAAESNLTRTMWARSVGIDARSLNCWRMILDRKAQRPRGTSAPKDVRFLELVTTAPQPTQSPWLVLRVKDVHIEVPQPIDGDNLALIIRTLARC